MEPKRRVDRTALEQRYQPVTRDRKVGDSFLFSLELDLRHVLSCFPCSLLVMLYMVNAELLSIGTSVLCPCWQVFSVKLVRVRIGGWLSVSTWQVLGVEWCAFSGQVCVCIGRGLELSQCLSAGQWGTDRGSRFVLS